MSAARDAGRDPLQSISLHIGDWIASETVALLGLTGEAIYLRLLMHQWKNETDGLPANPELLRRLTGATPKEWKSAWALIEKHFPTDPADGKRRNPRLVREWQFMRDRRESYRLRGSKGGKQTAKQWDGKASSSATHSAGSSADSTTLAPSPSPSQNSSSTAIERSVGVKVLHQSPRDLATPASAAHTRRGAA